MEDDSGLAPDPRIGGLVDERYKVLEAMASGSMGVVYKAERIPVGKLVAIKFLHAPFANDSEFLARFERETRVMSKLAHPNCVSVVDFGVWDGAPYLVMEYVSGTTLRALIDNGALPPKRAFALIRQIAAGLAHAHAQGVVHRDVKPANLMISEEIGTGDHVRILDFGLARLRGAVGRDATQTNVVVGTPNYMAPEQTVGGGLIDARTDIYAVGVVLFEMVTGDRPFQADDTLALLGMHRAAPIPQLADRMPEGVAVPAGLQDLIEKAMAKSPSDRYQSAIELAEAIDEVASARAAGSVAIRHSTEAKKVGIAPTMLDISDAELTARPPPPRRRSQPRTSALSTILLLALLAGGAGAAVWWLHGGKRDDAGDQADSAGSSTKPAGTASAPAVATPAGSAVAAGAADSATPGSATPGSAASGSAASGSATPGSAASGSAAPDSATPGSAAIATTGEPAGSGVATPGSGASSEPTGSAAGSSDAGSAAQAAAVVPTAQGSGADIEMDPATAEDPAPASTKPPNDDEDEAANAPKTTEEAEKHAPAAPALATNLNAAVQLIKDDKRDLALASLRALWKKSPSSSYIPFLLGNLYYDQRWWSVALDHYSAAIKKNARYRSNPTLNRNVIRMLASTKTSRKAQGFLRNLVGRPSLPYLRAAAKQDHNAQVRRYAAWLATRM
jgi:serine/threonine-protein kinase